MDQLSIRGSSSQDTPGPHQPSHPQPSHHSKRPPLLNSCDLQGVANYISSGRAKNIIIMAGAGISVSAGIPDFRSPGSGLYSRLQHLDLPWPEAVFDIRFFRHNPRPFYILAKDLLPGSRCPTAAHHFMLLLHQKGLLLATFTQNIDNLEQLAGVPACKVIPAHGSFDGAAADVGQTLPRKQSLRRAQPPSRQCTVQIPRPPPRDQRPELINNTVMFVQVITLQLYDGQYDVTTGQLSYSWKPLTGRTITPAGVRGGDKDGVDLQGAAASSSRSPYGPAAKHFIALNSPSIFLDDCPSNVPFFCCKGSDFAQKHSLNNVESLAAATAVTVIDVFVEEVIGTAEGIVPVLINPL
eukprot:gene7245-7458_t